MAYCIGIDVGSTATKAAVVDAESRALLHTALMPTGFSSVDASERMRGELARAGFAPEGCAGCVATGYGRVAVPYAGKAVTEITCHGAGAVRLFGPEGTAIDIGGQDTKVIQLKAGRVAKFAMNDKCAAGTGRFLEVMADRLGVSQEELSRMAAEGEPVRIASTCTVFAESEVISLIGRGEDRASIARGIVNSVVERVSALVGGDCRTPVFLTGGLCDNGLVVKLLSEVLGETVATCPEARYAGALGAALLACDRR